MSSTTKPVVLLDVDGVIAADSARHKGWDRWRHTWVETPGSPYGDGPWSILHSPEVVAWINELPKRAHVMWLTSWRHYANTHLAPALGLKAGFADAFDVAGVTPQRDGWQTLFRSKVAAFKALTASPTLHAPAGPLAGRHIVWVDDELDRHTRHSLKTRTTPTPLLVRTYSNLGLTSDLLERIDAYLDDKETR